MFRLKQKETNESLPKDMKQMIPLLRMLPPKVMEKQFLIIWKKKTKCLDNPEKNKKKISKLQSKQTKKIKYENKPVYDWLQEIIDGKTNKKFIKWYKTEYYKISLKDLGIFK